MKTGTRLSVVRMCEVAPKDREDAWSIVARAASGGQEQLDARREPLGGAGIGVDKVIECGATGFGLTAVRVSAVIEKPLERFGLDIFARAEDNRKPTPAEAVYVCTGANQEFHICSLARLRRTHQLLNEEQANSGLAARSFSTVASSPVAIACLTGWLFRAAPPAP